MFVFAFTFVFASCLCSCFCSWSCSFIGTLLVVVQSYNRLPEHCVPSPAKPGLHVQVWEPKVLAQLAFLSHLCVPVLHSSISKDKCVCMCDISAL